MISSYTKVEECIAYSFTSAPLLEQALRHRSVGKDNNERLEFLGDAVLDVIISEALYEKFTDLPEGKMSRLRASLVCGAALSKMATSFNLGEFLELGSGELKSGGRRRHSILADTLEAIIGAIYLDAGFDTCKKVVLQWYANALDNLDLSLAEGDPKSLLQEWLQKRQYSLPDYQTINITGEEHEQMFLISCTVQEANLTVQAESNTIKNAQRKAAKEMLGKLKSIGSL